MMASACCFIDRYLQWILTPVEETTSGRRVFVIIGIIWILWLSLLCLILGSMIGSFLNVVIHRLPRGQSLVFPGSHCGACGTSIRLSDNIPLFSYWILGGRCRTCQIGFSLRYFWVELAMAVAFLLVFLLEIVANVNRIHQFGTTGFDSLMLMRFPLDAPLYFLVRVTMLAWLAPSFWIALERSRFPSSLLVSGVLLAFLVGAFFPWPWPDRFPLGVASSEEGKNWVLIDQVNDHNDPFRRFKPPPHATMAQKASRSWSEASASPRIGLQPWPFWGPVPQALLPNQTQKGTFSFDAMKLGLVTGVVGLLAGGLVGCVMATLGLPGFVPLMILTGGFLGWQPLVIPLLLVMVGWLLVLPARLYFRDKQPLDALRELPGLGVVLAWFGWPWFSTLVYPVLFDARMVVSLLGFLILIQLLSSLAKTASAAGIRGDASR